MAKEISKVLISEYVKQYTEYGLATGDFDSGATERFVKWIYRRIYMNTPEIIIMDSPYEAKIAAFLLFYALKQPEKYPISTIHSDHVMVENGYNKRYFMTVLYNECVAMANAEVNRILRVIGKRIKNKIQDTNYRSIIQSLNRPISANVINNVGSLINLRMIGEHKSSRDRIDEIRKKIQRLVKKRIRPKASEYIFHVLRHHSFVKAGYSFELDLVKFGQFLAHRYAFCDFVLKHFDLGFSDIFKEEYNMCRDALTGISGRIFTFDNFCIISRRPKLLKTNSDGQLHSDDSPCVEYHDGIKIYRMNGILIPENFIKKSPDEINVESVLSITNVDVRREVIRKVGLERLIKGRKPIHKSNHEELSSYALHRIIIRGNRAVFLEMKNPSTGDIHVEGVHPDCNTVEGALAWRNNIKGENYIAPKILT